MESVLRVVFGAVGEQRFPDRNPVKCSFAAFVNLVPIEEPQMTAFDRRSLHGIPVGHTRFR